MKKISFPHLGHHPLPGNSPSREWNLLLAAFAISILLSFALGALVFLRIRAGGFGDSSSAPAASREPIDAEAISSVIRFYEGGKGRVDNLAASGRLLVDPSL